MKIENPYNPKKVLITKVIQENSDTKTLRLAHTLEYEPGQFLEVSLLNMGEAPFVVSSYSSKYLEVCVRRVGNLTAALHGLGRGECVWIRGPYGVGYPLKESVGKNMLLVAGGTGASPMRSVIEYLARNKRDYGGINVFLGFRSPEEILFKRDVKSWSKKFSLRLTVDKADGNWGGDVGVITTLFDRYDVSAENTNVFVCGPPVMIRFVVQKLGEKGFADDQIYVSLERMMKCGIRKCGRCMVRGKYICHDGPVFSWTTAKTLED